MELIPLDFEIAKIHSEELETLIYGNLTFEDAVSLP
jgi:hypothetical protein